MPIPWRHSKEALQAHCKLGTERSPAASQAHLTPKKYRAALPGRDPLLGFLLGSAAPGGRSSIPSTSSKRFKMDLASNAARNAAMELIQYLQWRVRLGRCPQEVAHVASIDDLTDAPKWNTPRHHALLAESNQVLQLIALGKVQQRLCLRYMRHMSIKASYLARIGATGLLRR